jgi:hypothetical protein
MIFSRLDLIPKSGRILRGTGFPVGYDSPRRSPNRGIVSLKPSDLDPHLAAQLLAEGVDLPRMLRFLDDLNAGSYPEAPTVVAESFPALTILRSLIAGVPPRLLAGNPRDRTIRRPRSSDKARVAWDRLVGFPRFDEAACAGSAFFYTRRPRMGFERGAARATST